MVNKSMSIIKVKELMGTSPKSFEDALENVIGHICSRKQNVTGVKILSQTVEVRDGKIVEYKVNVKFAYRWEKEVHQ